MEVLLLDNLVIQSWKGPYCVRFGEAFEGLESGLAPNEHLIIDEHVAGVYSKELSSALSSRSVLRLGATESNKSLEKISSFAEHLLKRGIRRDHVLVAVGGGIIQDITAFLAAILLRGIPWRFYPTTLLAQADSCIGSKSSLNIGRYKNQAGTFTPPDEIRISTKVLRTLGHVELQSGVGEIIKTHIIEGWQDTKAIAADYERLFQDDSVMAFYTRRALEIKKAKIEIDEFDRNERLVMNYGHTFGHAIESATEYAVPHGIAVTIGMDMANYLSWRLDMIARSVYEDLHRLLARNYSGFSATSVPEEPFFQALSRDKKHVGGDLTMVLMRGPGEVFRTRRPNDQHFRNLCVDYFDRFSSDSLPAPVPVKIP